MVRIVRTMKFVTLKARQGCPRTLCVVRRYKSFTLRIV